MTPRSARTPPSGAWQAIGPTGGNITVLASDPNAPHTVYAGTSSGGTGGIWKSLDSGATWQYLVTNTAADVYPILDIAVAGNTIYVATELSLVRSSDGGNSWVQVSVLQQHSIGAMAVDPRNTSTIYLSIPGQGVAKSSDSGNTWQLLSGSPIITTGTAPAVLHNPLAVDPQSGAIYYGTDHGLYFSSNGGSTWSKGTGFASGYTELRDVVVSPVDPTHLFALAAIPGLTVDDLYTSTNGAASWTLLARSLDAERVVPDLQDVQTIYLSGLSFHDVYKSVDGGTTFNPSDTGMPIRSGASPGYLVLTGPTGTILLLPSNPTTLLAGSLILCVYRSQNAAQSWVPSDNGISSFTGAAVTYDPENPNTIYFGDLSGGGIWRSPDNGLTWTNLFQGSVTTIAVDPFDSLHIIAADLTKGLIQSNDGGATWQTVTALPAPSGGTAMITGITFNPKQAGTIYISLSRGGLGVIKSVDNGQTYVTMNTGLTTDQVYSPVAVNIANPDMLFVGTSAGLFKSSDGGHTWALKTSEIFSLISIDAKSATPVIYGSGAGINASYKSTNLGETWHVVPYGNLIVADPSTANSLFTPDAWSPDGGQTWQQLLTSGLGQISTISANQFGGFVLAPSSPQVLYMASPSNSLLRFVVGP